MVATAGLLQGINSPGAQCSQGQNSLTVPNPESRRGWSYGVLHRRKRPLVGESGPPEGVNGAPADALKTVLWGDTTIGGQSGLQPQKTTKNRELHNAHD